MKKQITLSAGGLGIAVTVRETARCYVLSYRDGAKALDRELQQMVGHRNLGPSKGWSKSISKCRRNEIQLELLQGRVPPEIQRYKDPLVVDYVSPGRELLPHQPKMVSFLLQRKRCILHAEPGTGKTLAAIEAMEAVGGDWVYVGPAKVLTAVRLEFKKWNSKVTPRFCSYTSLQQMLEAWEGPAPRGVVYDESTKVKGAGNRQSRAAQYLANQIREENDGYVFLMTGLAEQNAPTDWWSQAEIACPGYLREGSVAKLTHRMAHMRPQDTADGRTVSVVDYWIEEESACLGRRLRGLVLHMKSEDVLDLPDIEFIEVKIPVSDSLRRDAKALAATAESGLKAMSQLRQLSDSFLYTDGVTMRLPENPKGEALLEILQREAGRGVVFSCYRESSNIVQEICLADGWEIIRCDGKGWSYIGDTYENHEDALLDMDRGQNRWLAPKLMTIGHPLSLSMGFTLHASLFEVFYSNDFNRGSRVQALERVHRNGMGTERPRVYDLLHLATDRLVLDNFAKKKKIADITLEEIKGILV